MREFTDKISAKFIKVSHRNFLQYSTKMSQNNYGHHTFINSAIPA